MRHMPRSTEPVSLARANRHAVRLRLLAVGLSLAGLVAFLAYAGGTGDEELARFGMNLLVVPIVVAALFFGGRGAAICAIVAVLVGLILCAVAGVFPAWIFVTRSLVICLVAGIVGWAVERERAAVRAVRDQRRVLERRHALSLELLAALRDGCFAEANPSWERKLGYPPETLIGREFLELVHADDREQAAQTRDKLLHGEDVTVHVSRFTHADGSYLWVEWSARNDPLDGLVYIAGRDVTARHDAEQSLAQRKEVLERTVAERTAELQARTSELERTSRELELERHEDLKRLALVAEFRDDKTAQHTERVGIVSALIAQELGLPDSDVQIIREAAPLHDIGKIGVPDAILLNTSGFSEAEWAVMRQHAELGHRILSSAQAPVLSTGAEIALGHHEWWDGSGYPQGLAGEQIPLAARIVALADVFDALTHDRPYKPAWALEAALDEIASLSGRQFDPAVVEAFQRIDRSYLTTLVEPEPRQRLRSLAG
jgi:PAS domain S-box-containing protein